MSLSVGAGRGDPRTYDTTVKGQDRGQPGRAEPGDGHTKGGGTLEADRDATASREDAAWARVACKPCLAAPQGAAIPKGVH